MLVCITPEGNTKLVLTTNHFLINIPDTKLSKTTCVYNMTAAVIVVRLGYLTTSLQITTTPGFSR